MFFWTLSIILQRENGRGGGNGSGDNHAFWRNPAAPRPGPASHGCSPMPGPHACMVGIPGQKRSLSAIPAPSTAPARGAGQAVRALCLPVGQRRPLPHHSPFPRLLVCSVLSHGFSAHAFYLHIWLCTVTAGAELSREKPRTFPAAGMQTNSLRPLQLSVAGFS